MNSLMDIVANPLIWKVIICYWVFSAAVGALPTPESSAAKWYIFAFRFAHALGGNLNRAAVTLKVPGAQEEPKP